MYSSIKKIIKESLEDTNSRIHTGKVLSVNPLAVAIAPSFVLTKRELIIPSSLREVRLKTKDKHYTGEDEHEYVLREELKPGEHVIIINIGEDYLVLDKVGDIDEPIIITKQ